MSTALEKRLTATQRATQAAQQAAELLGLSDAKAVAAALAEAALEGVRHETAFAARVRSLYGEIAARPGTRARPKQGTSRKAAPDVELVPRKHVGAREANPGATPDPYYLLELYEADQLPLALARYKGPDLKLAAKLVQERTPGTKLPTKGGREALIEFIIRHVTASA